MLRPTGRDAQSRSRIPCATLSVGLLLPLSHQTSSTQPRASSEAGESVAQPPAGRRLARGAVRRLPAVPADTASCVLSRPSSSVDFGYARSTAAKAARKLKKPEAADRPTSHSGVRLVVGEVYVLDVRRCPRLPKPASDRDFAVL